MRRPRDAAQGRPDASPTSAGCSQAIRCSALTLGAGIVAVAGLPPFGLFASEFLIATETVRRIPWLALPLGLGLSSAPGRWRRG